MKVTHLIAGNLNGGAARGAVWLHLGLLRSGVDSVILCENTYDDADAHIQSLITSKAQLLALKLKRRSWAIIEKLYLNRKNRIYSTGFGGLNFTQHVDVVSADIVHLHWINGLVDMRHLSQINKPIVWTMRDMWPFTGGCHYSMNCLRYEKSCGQCPQLGSSAQFDLSSLILMQKQKYFPKNMHLVGVSSWLSDCAHRSKVFENYEVQTIANCVNTDIFFPLEKKAAKRTLGLPENKKIVLVGANNVRDFYKGFDLFLAAVRDIVVQDVQIVCFGEIQDIPMTINGKPIKELGYLSDDHLLRIAYSAADVFVAPSRMEAFGKTLIEAMACGTPVVCFDSTGPADIVSHKQTGFKAKPYEAVDLKTGIEWVISKSNSERFELGRKSRQRVLDRYESTVVARQYCGLYHRILK